MRFCLQQHFHEITLNNRLPPWNRLQFHQPLNRSKHTLTTNLEAFYLHLFQRIHIDLFHVLRNLFNPHFRLFWYQISVTVCAIYWGLGNHFFWTFCIDRIERCSYILNIGRYAQYDLNRSPFVGSGVRSVLCKQSVLGGTFWLLCCYITLIGMDVYWRFSFLWWSFNCYSLNTGRRS